MIVVEGVRVLVKPDKEEERTESGLYKAISAVDKEARAKTQGTFVAMGPNADLNFGKAQLCEGDRVAFVRYAGEDISDGEDTFWVMNDCDILALIVDDK